MAREGSLKMNHQWKVIHIYEADFGCEGRPDGMEAQVDLVLEDPEGAALPRKVRMSDALTYERDINEGDLVKFKPDGTVCKAD